MKAFILVLLSSLAFAHDILYEVKDGGAIAVRVFFSDGEEVAYALYEVYSPADDKVPYQRGRTDRRGYLSFVPNVPGKWKVKVVESSGHGLVFLVDVREGTQTEGRSKGPDPLRLGAGLLGLSAVLLALKLVRRKG